MKIKGTKGNLSSRLLILIFVILAAGILTAGYLFYSNYEKNYRAQVEQQLSAIGDLKVGELVQWRKERLADANQLYGNPAFSSLVQRYFEHPDDVVAQEQLRSWLTLYQEYGQYSGIFLLATQGAGRMFVPDTVDPVPRHIQQGAYQVLQSGKVTILDLDRGEDTPQPHMEILIPIFSEKDDHVPLGVVVMRIDPYQYLYPLISRWPTPSTTAETLIVRRDGNDALFLNELKFQKDTALKLRIPLVEKDTPAVKAVLGEEGIVEGRDYRGEIVISDVIHVPNSPWFMVARIDHSEVYTPLTQMLWVIIALVGALLIGAGTGVGLVWRQQNIRVYKERAETAERLRESESKYSSLVDTAGAGVASVDLQGNLTFVNNTFIEMMGYTGEDLAGKPFLNFVHPGDRKQLQDKFLTGLEKPEDRPVLEFRALHKNGNYLWLYSSPTPLIVEGNLIGFTAIATDITDSKNSESELLVSHDQLRNLAARLQITREDERKNIAAEIHDDLGQSMIALQIDLSWLIKRMPLDQKELLEKAESMLRLVKVTDEKVREIATDLRPPLLDDLGFVTAAQSYLSEFVEKTGIKCEFFSEPEEIILDANVSIAVFRVLQGALINVVKHAKATRIKISLVEQTDGLYMEISDNGRGITEKELVSRKSIGIIGMRERIAFFGGSLQIEGRPGKGTTVKVKIPVQGDMFE